MKINESVIRARLKSIRKERALTVNDVESKLGKTNNTYLARIESGQQNLTFEIIKELCNVYEISALSLFEQPT